MNNGDRGNITMFNVTGGVNGTNGTNGTNSTEGIVNLHGEELHLHLQAIEDHHHRHEYKFDPKYDTMPAMSGECKKGEYCVKTVN